MTTPNRRHIAIIVAGVKPPICEVCDSLIDRGDGELVSFVVDEATRSFDVRAEQPGFVGHRPNSGWFCVEHLPAARARSQSMTLGDAVRDIAGRSGVRQTRPPEPTPLPPVPGDGDGLDPWPVEPVPIDSPDLDPRVMEGYARCAVCAVIFPKRAGGPVDFVVERVVFPPRFDYPNRRWFCTRHLGPAMMIRRSVDVATARAALQPFGRRPFEYNEAPPGIEPGSVDENGEPLHGPFAPTPDERLRAETVPSVVTVAPRIADDASVLLRQSIAEIGRALGIEHLRSTGSTSTRSDPFEPQLVSSPAQRCATSISTSHGHDVAVFVILATYYGEAVDGEEPVLGEHARLLVQQQQASILELVIGAGEDGQLAPDGQHLLDQVSVRITPSKQPNLEDVVASLLERLQVPAFDPFALGPDLEGEDLHGGTVKRNGPDHSRIVWTFAPVAVSEVRERFLQLVPELFEELGLGTMPELERVDRRDWTPMDGSVAPNCPYVDYVDFRHTDDDNRTVVSVNSDQSHWSDHEISNVSAGFHIDVGGVRVSAHAYGRGAHDACTVLSLARPTSRVVIDALFAAFGPFSNDGR